MDITTAYKTLQGECGFKIGDKVKVLRKAESYKLGWATSWHSNMDKYIGNTYTIKDISSGCCGVNGFQLGTKDDRYWFPWFVLELVEKKPEVKEMTVREISDKLGYEVKVIREEN